MFTKIEKVTAYLVFSLLLLSLLPVAYLGRYNHPTGDDYYYGAETRLVWEDTHSIAAALGEAARGAAADYKEWQGTYSAMWLMRLQPSVFSEKAYCWVTFSILSLLTGSIFYLLKPLVTQILKGSGSLWLILSSLLAILAIQTVPSQGETFFWYNGSIYYTGYFSLTLLFWGLLCRYLQGGRSYRLVLCLLLAVFLAGGNYVSLLPCLILLFCLAFLLFWQKRYRKAWPVAALSVLMLAGLALSAAAPGNYVRQSDMWKIPAWKAILKSLFQGLLYMDAWIGKWWILTAILLTPFLWLACRRATFRFRCPLLVIAFLYGIFCSMSCPTFYTMNSTGPARAVAIVYYGFILFTFAGYWYLIGYLSQKLDDCLTLKPGSAALSKIIMPVAGAVFLTLLLQLAAAGAFRDFTTVKSLKLLASGEAQQYHQEYQARLAILTDPSITDAVLPSFLHQPEMLYVGDIGQDPMEPTNRKVAQFFHKNSVIVVPHFEK